MSIKGNKHKDRKNLWPKKGWKMTNSCKDHIVDCFFLKKKKSPRKTKTWQINLKSRKHDRTIMTTILKDGRLRDHLKFYRAQN